MIEASGQLALLDESAAQGGWTIRRSARAKRLSARVHRDCRVEIVVPNRAAPQRVEEFVARYRHWIERKLAAARSNPPPAELFPPTELTLAAFGEALALRLIAGPRSPRARLGAGNVLILCGDLNDRRKLTLALQRWLASHARVRLEAMLNTQASALGFKYRNISVRRQRSRWGSCSVRGTINLNVALAFQPPEVVRYLLIHELAHTRFMNHSPRFWATVAACCPDWHELDRQLMQGWRRVPSWIFA